MQHLRPSRQDDQTAADDVRPWRWPDGVTCPRCGSETVEPRARCDNGLQRCNGVHGAVRWGQQCALCTAWPSALCEERKVRPVAWWRVSGLGPVQRNATAMAAAADIQERTAQRCRHVLDGGLEETDPLDPTRQLEHHVAADACSHRAGSTGLARAGARRDRAPSPRGMQRRGRTTAETGRPPLLGVVQRRAKRDQDTPAAPVSLAVLEHGRTATSTPMSAAKGKVGAPCCTDAYPLDHGTKADDDHRPVNHGAGAYARRAPDGTCVHCNPMEGLWSGLRKVLEHCKGLSQRFLHLRVACSEFLHNDQHVHWCQTCEAPLRSMFSTTGASLRRMAHQHRRMPLTLCYR